MDYGHALSFGTFLTPSAGDPQEPVALAQLSDELGLDVVTFQDHPYQPAFLDTQTLLAYTAARTEHVRLAAAVTNLPLRPPAVLARAAASLDLLSGGRFVLGLGAGAFWDAIEAMGGERLTPGDAVEALDEAITVVRELWRTDVRGVVRVEGRHHRVVGAKRGPAPAHRVPIWVGAYGPRMLRLVGRRADGWLPSLSYLPGVEALGAMNEAIDAGATAAGREPHAVRRLLNLGPDAADARLLTDIALRFGVSGFLLGSDERETITRFAREVAPAVREAVGAARA